MTVHVTLSLAEAQKAELERLASRENISIEVLLARLVEQQLEEWRQVDEELAEAQADFAAGRFVDHAVVVAESEARYRAAEPE